MCVCMCERERERERERYRPGRCITLTPRVVTCKCGVKTDVNIRTNGGVAGVRNGEAAWCGAASGLMN